MVASDAGACAADVGRVSAARRTAELRIHCYRGPVPIHSSIRSAVRRGRGSDSPMVLPTHRSDRLESRRAPPDREAPAQSSASTAVVRPFASNLPWIRPCLGCRSVSRTQMVSQNGAAYLVHRRPKLCARADGLRRLYLVKHAYLFTRCFAELPQRIDARGPGSDQVS